MNKATKIDKKAERINTAFDDIEDSLGEISNKIWHLKQFGYTTERLDNYIDQAIESLRKLRETNPGD